MEQQTIPLVSRTIYFHILILLLSLIEIFFHCLENGSYKCWLEKDQALPMIYVDDCIKATMQFLRADKANLTRTTYNLAGISFTPEEMATEVMKLIPDSEVEYKPCSVRSSIAA